jgi:FkbM family methyltransferase
MCSSSAPIPEEALLTTDFFRLRAAKAIYMLVRPSCWRALRYGVAPSIEHLQVLTAIQPDLVLDVGANRGQFTLMTRLVHPFVPVIAYEPLRSEAVIYRKVHHGAAQVSLHEVALGSEKKRSDLHVSGRADSSSLLQIGRLQSQFFPSTREVGRQSVQVVTLDDMPQHWMGSNRALLKIDVQGFELHVLRGAVKALQHCAWVYVECSEMNLYEGQALRPEVAAFVERCGFRSCGRFNAHFAEGRLIQADYLYSR